MGDSQDPGGGDLDSYSSYGREFAPPSKDSYSPANGTDLGGDSHNLTHLKGGGGAGSFSDPDGIPSMELRYAELQNWDLAYAQEGLQVRLLDTRAIESGDQIIQYRPWEKPDPSQSPTLTSTIPVTSSSLLTSANGKSPTLTTLTSAFPNFQESFSVNGQKLPSFQSQFNSFQEQQHHFQIQNGDHYASASSALPSFHTLPANRPYIHGHTTLLSTPVQRELPQLGQPLLDERHIHLFPSPMGSLIPPQASNGHHYVMTNVVTNGTGFNTGNGSTMLDLVPVSPMHMGPTAGSTSLHHALHASSSSKTLTTDGNIPGLNISLNNEPQALNLPKYLNANENPIETLIAVKIPSSQHTFMHQASSTSQQLSKLSNQPQQASPQIVTNSHVSTNSGHGGTPKRQQKRKRNSIDSIDSLSCHSLNSGDHNEPQVSSSVSSTESDFKRPTPHNQSMVNHDGVDTGLEKPAKKKRKRCGECTGCQKKDNCGDCAPCRNEKSHQICKMRRCEKLTEKKPNTRGEKMDGRARQGPNSSSGPSSGSSVMSGFYGGNGNPAAASSSGGEPSNFSPRERFWSQQSASGSTSSTPDLWSNQSYTPQILPGPEQHPNFSPSQPSPTNVNFAPINIPPHSPYPSPMSQPNGNVINGPNGDMNFSGPAPPNQIHPISVSPYPSTNTSPRRQYTPSTTPSPHVHGSSPSNNNNSNIGNPAINNNNNNNNNNNVTSSGVNGNGINGSSGHSRSDSSPPPNFDMCINGNESRVNGNGRVSNGHANISSKSNASNGPNETTGHPNEVPGYLHLPRQSSLSSSRYPGDVKASDGESLMHQYSHPRAAQDQPSYYAPDYSPYGGASEDSGHLYRAPYDFHQPVRKPFEPYQPYTGEPSFDSYRSQDTSSYSSSSHDTKLHMKTEQKLFENYDKSPFSVDSKSFSSEKSLYQSDKSHFSSESKPSIEKSSYSGDGMKQGGYSSEETSGVLTDSMHGSDDLIKKERKETTKELSNLDTFLALGHPQSPSATDEVGSKRQQVPLSEGGDSDSKSKDSRFSSSLDSNKKKKFKKSRAYEPKPFMSSEEKLERLCAESESEYGRFKFERDRKNVKDDSCGGKSNTSNEESRSPKSAVGVEEETTTTTGSSDKKDVPLVECGCFPVDEVHPEPGPFYTHLGSAGTLAEMRDMMEQRTGFRASQLRFEKVIYTGKEGKTSQGCPLAKWVIRRGSYEEQLLFLVKHRKGHKCANAWIVICCVIWEGVPSHFADNLYDTMVYKLNRFGIPTTRRSDTNEQRSCACQGVDPDLQGAAYSFGCAWSMFFNGCKYARSRNVRKFRLTEEHEESELEEKVQHLATHLGPLYERVAPDSYRNQIDNENEGLECRLGYRPGRPFSGVTVCLDYCSHAHKDAHNMINGCTVSVSFTRNRSLAKGEDEQYHLLPLYKLDETDEFGSKDGQKLKVKKGQLEILKKFPCKVRVRKVPLLPSRRRGKITKPSSSGGGGGGGGGAAPPVSQTSPRAFHSGSEMSGLGIPPAKREKTGSLFDELPNGTSSDLFHSPLHSHSTAFSNLLMSKNHSKMNLEDIQSCQISSTVLDPDSSSASALWNHFGHHPTSHSHDLQGHPGPAPPFRSCFDHFSPTIPTSAPISPSPAPAGPSFGNNFDLNRSLSSSNLTSSMHVNSNSHSSHFNSPHLTSVSTASTLGGLSASRNLSPTTGSSYSSMSPILPSFRHTFMPDGEPASMLSCMSSPTAGSPPDSTSSSRSATAASSVKYPPLHPAQFSHGLSSNFQDGNSNYFPGSYASPSGGSSGIYHPHIHHPANTCLSVSSSAMSHGVPFPSASTPAGYGGANASSYAPPNPPQHHHPPNPPSHTSIDHFSPINLGWNNNQVYSQFPSSNSYGVGTASGYHQPPPGVIGMSSAGSAYHMNQYGPYGSPLNPPPNPNSHHALNHSSSPWGASLSFGHHSSAAAPPPPPPPCFVAPPKPKVIPEVTETFSDNEEAFKDGHLGGVAIALTHGAVLLQCAKHEMHATTALKNPNRLYPSRICLVFYQHKSMNHRFHGWSEWEKKIEAKKIQEVRLINQGKLEASPRKMKQLIKEGYLADNL